MTMTISRGAANGAWGTHEMTTRDEKKLQDGLASIWVEAHAGSGKTYLLTRRVLLLLLQAQGEAKILCLTFTRAAAGEMRARILAALHDWQTKGDVELAKDLENLTGQAPTAPIMQQARSIFARMLEAPDMVRIETIHAFCRMLLERFAHEAGILPGFRVIGEHEAQFLRADAERALFQAIDTEPELREALAASLAPNEGLDIRDALALLLDHQAVQALQALPAQALAAMLTQMETQAAALAKRGHLQPDPSMQDTADLLVANQSPSDQNKAAIIKQFTAGDLTLTDDYLAIFFTQAWQARKKLASEAALRAYPPLLDQLLTERKRLTDCLTARDESALLRATAGFVKLVIRQKSLLEAHKRREGVLDYDDLINKSAQLLTCKEAKEWVLFKMDGGLNHLLVDEAQDTSPAQWQIIQALSESFYAGAGSGDEKTLFVVGDPKQSIFSFQGADVQYFAKMHDFFAKRFQEAGRVWHDIPNTRSWRTQEPVLQVIDQIFTHPDLRVGLTPKKDTPPLEKHQAQREETNGGVAIWPPEEGERASASAPLYPGQATIQRDHPAQRLARRIAGEIVRLVRKEKIEPNKIMILTRKRGQFTQAMLQALRDAGIPASGEARMPLCEHPAVMDLTALAKFALLPEDDLNLAALLKSPLIGLEEEDLLKLAANRKGQSVWAALQQRAAEQKKGIYHQAENLLRESFNFADQQTIFAFFADALFRQGGRGKLLGALGAGAAPVISQFLDLTLSYANDHPPSLQNFLLWLAASGAEIKKGEGSDNHVQLHTIHGAKGLEGDIVFLATTPPHAPRPPFFFWNGKTLPLFVPRNPAFTPAALRTAQQHHAQAELEEMNRLLYVALTRARDRLVICGHQDQNKHAPLWLEAIMKRVAEHVQTPPEFLESGIAASEEESAPAAPLAQDVAPVAQPSPHRRHLVPSAFDLGVPVSARSLLEPVAKEEARHYGILFHDLLRHAAGLSPDDLRHNGKAWLQLRGVEQAQQEKMLAQAEQLLAHPPARDFLLAKGVRHEVPVEGLLHAADGSVFHLSARLDLLRAPEKAGGEVYAADIKTSANPPETIESLEESIWQQMALYYGLLQKLYPQSPIRMALLWSATPRVMLLPPESLQQKLDDFMAKQT